MQQRTVDHYYFFQEMMGMRRAPQHILNPTDLSSSNVTFDKKLSYLHKTNAVQWANEFRNLHISDPNLVRELLDAKMANVFGRTLLHEKICRKDLVGVEICIELGADINAFNDDAYNWTPLHEAVTHATPRIVYVCLQAGADPNLLNISNLTARDMVGVGRYVTCQREKERLFQVYDLEFDASRESFIRLPNDMKQRMKCFAMCRIRQRNLNDNNADPESVPFNIGHLPKLCLDLILEFLWADEKHYIIQQLITET